MQNFISFSEHLGLTLIEEKAQILANIRQVPKLCTSVARISVLSKQEHNFGNQGKTGEIYFF